MVTVQPRTSGPPPLTIPTCGTRCSPRFPYCVLRPAAATRAAAVPGASGEVSERQWQDVLGVLKVQRGHLAIDYMSHWAQGIGVADLLASALREAAG